MPKIIVPPNTGSVRVAMGLGGKFTVWNGKQGQHEFSVACRNRAAAVKLAAEINARRKEGTIEVEFDPAK
ncbi:MAG TPA: hypothetical protein VGN72_22950 [Tepidisphaeraceae bacterium]|jgi:predicted secreted protein|nr:hypothetical protein [Tepidisphaeraceae bacterium]